LFKLEGTHVKSVTGFYIEVKDALDRESQPIQVFNKIDDGEKHGLGQEWDLVYADEYPDEPTKGELNEEFGLYVERDFFIVSNQSSHKYMQVVNNRDMVVKTRNGRKEQVFYFDQKRKAIIPRSVNKSVEIKNSGKNKEMIVYNNSYSHWW